MAAAPSPVPSLSADMEMSARLLSASSLKPDWILCILLRTGHFSKCALIHPFCPGTNETGVWCLAKVWGCGQVEVTHNSYCAQNLIMGKAGAHLICRAQNLLLV